jgi:hypothetical protein
MENKNLVNIINHDYNVGTKFSIRKKNTYASRNAIKTKKKSRNNIFVEIIF